MNELTPTRIVDRNGRLTTVHKKNTVVSASPALAGVKPALPKGSESPVIHIIKGKPLHAQSLSLKLLAHDEPQQYRLTSCTGEFEWRKKTEMPDDLLYDYLRCGVDVQDAAALYGMQVMPDEIEDHPVIGEHAPGRLGRIGGSDAFWMINNRRVIDRFQAAGIPAVVAEKPISNKIQDPFLDKALDEHQLVQLFSRWKYSTVYGGVRTRQMERVIEAFVRGKLPLTVMDLKTEDLKDITDELLMSGNNRFDELRHDEKTYEAVIRKAAASMTGRNRLDDMLRLVKRHGNQVMELDDPYLCSVTTEEGDIVGIETAKYLDGFFRILAQSHDRVENNNKYQFWGGTFVGGGYVKNSDLLYLREAGISPQEAYEGLVVNKIEARQIVVAKEDNLHSGLLGGAL